MCFVRESTRYKTVLSTYEVRLFSNLCDSCPFPDFQTLRKNSKAARAARTSVDAPVVRESSPRPKRWKPYYDSMREDVRTILALSLVCLSVCLAVCLCVCPCLSVIFLYNFLSFSVAMCVCVCLSVRIIV